MSENGEVSIENICHLKIISNSFEDTGYKVLWRDKYTPCWALWVHLGWDVPAGRTDADLQVTFSSLWCIHCKDIRLVHLLHYHHYNNYKYINITILKQTITAYEESNSYEIIIWILLLR